MARTPPTRTLRWIMWDGQEHAPPFQVQFQDGMRQLTSFGTRPAVARGAAAPPHRHIHHRHGRGHHDGSFQAQCNQQGSHLQPDRRRKHQATFPTMCLVVELHKKAEDFGSQMTYYQKWTPRTCVLARTQTVLSHAKKFVSLQEDCQLTKTDRF